MSRIRGLSDNGTKSPILLSEDMYLSMVRSTIDKMNSLNVKEESREEINTFKNRKYHKNLCDGLYNLIKSEQSIDGNYFNANKKNDICGKCKSCQDIKAREEDRKLIQKKLEASMTFSKTSILQPSLEIKDISKDYNHFEFVVQNLQGSSYGQKIDYYKSNNITDNSDWQSDWTYYKQNHKFESYVRRYILHTETPIEEMPDTMLLTGLLSGALISQIVILLVLCFYNWSFLSKRFEQLIIIWRMLRSILFFNIFILLISVNIYVWQIFGINHILIFELDPRSHVKFQSIIKISMLFVNIWCCSIINFILYHSHGGYYWTWPMICILLIIIWISNPLPYGYYKARRWIWNVTIRIILTPIYQVNFAEFWIADQLNSMSFVMVDVVNGMHVYYNILSIYGLHWNGSVQMTNNKIFYLSVKSQIITCLTIKLIIVWFRLGQCLRRYYDVKKVFPHLINGGKYLCSMITLILTSLKLCNPTNRIILYFFICAFVVNTIYAYLWDIVMDWKMFKLERNTIVIRQIMYKKSYYIIAAIINGIVRLYWISLLFSEDEIVISIGLFLEMIRRFIWNFFRVENEHINNCGNFRAVRE